jgi:EmrB/QacA subfamily drug resistance transporter
MSQDTKISQQVDSYQWLALMTIVLGAFMAVLDSSLVNVALPKIQAVLGSTTDTIEWVLTGYMLASAVVIPMSGFLGDKFGYKTMFTVALSGFTISSLLCGIAWSDMSLIFFRIVQGLSGGFIMPLSMALIYSIFPLEKIGLALGIWGIAAMAAPAIGPTLSGYIVEYVSWRFLFLVNLPVGIVAVTLGTLLLKETPKREGLKFDLMGSVLSIVFFSSLLLALSKGETEGWTSFYIISLFYVAFSSFLLLLWVETGKEQPILDFRFFKNPIFSLSTLCSSLVMMGMYGGVFLTPIYLQNIQNLSPIQTGLVMMPQSIAMALMMPISGKLFDKFGVVPLALVGLSLLGVTTYKLHMLTADTPNNWLDFILTVRGIGIGLSMMPLTTAGMNAVPRHLVGRASSVSNVTRQVMGSFAIAILTAIMTNREVFHATMISDSIPLNSYPASQALIIFSNQLMQGGTDIATSKGGAFGLLAQMIQQEGLVRGIADTFLVSSIPIFICIPLIFLFIKQRKDKEENNRTEVVQ